MIPRLTDIDQCDTLVNIIHSQHFFSFNRNEVHKRKQSPERILSTLRVSDSIDSARIHVQIPTFSQIRDLQIRQRCQILVWLRALLKFTGHLEKDKIVPSGKVGTLTFSFSSITRRILPPINLMTSSFVQLLCEIKYSINRGYPDTSSRPWGVLIYKANLDTRDSTRSNTCRRRRSRLQCRHYQHRPRSEYD